MKRYLTAEEEETYNRLEGFAREIECAQDNLFRAALDADIPDRVKLCIIRRIDKMHTRSLAYDLHVQHEWTGGDSLKGENFKATSPNIER